MVCQVDLGGEEGIVQDFVRLGHNGVQVRVYPFACLENRCQKNFNERDDKNLHLQDTPI